MWLYRIIILGIVLMTWIPVIASRFVDYNVAAILLYQSVMISITGFISIAVFYFMDKKIVKSDRNLTIFYFATSTPISIFLFVYSFNEVFGRFIHHSN